MKIEVKEKLDNGFALEMAMHLNADEMEIITNALAVYVEHEMGLLSELKERGDTPDLEPQEGVFQVSDVVGGTLKDTIQLRQGIVKQLGYDPTNG